MKRTLLIIFICSFEYVSLGQKVIGSSGEHFSSSNAGLSFTIGEPIVATMTSQNTILTQGFHQSNLIVSTINENITKNISIDVFPNPVADVITIRNEENIQGNVRLMDLNGKVLKYDRLNNTQQEYDLSHLQTGVYLIDILNTEGLSIKTFRIIKTH